MGRALCHHWGYRHALGPKKRENDPCGASCYDVRRDEWHTEQRGGRVTQKRVAILAGLRTPFQKQSTGFSKLTALDLGVAVVTELLARADISAASIDQLVFGQVLPSLEGPNVAREIVLAAGLPRRVEAYSVSRA